MKRIILGIFVMLFFSISHAAPLIPYKCLPQFVGGPGIQFYSTEHTLGFASSWYCDGEWEWEYQRAVKLRSSSFDDNVAMEALSKDRGKQSQLDAVNALLLANAVSCNGVITGDLGTLCLAAFRKTTEELPAKFVLADGYTVRRYNAGKIDFSTMVKHNVPLVAGKTRCYCKNVHITVEAPNSYPGLYCNVDQERYVAQCVPVKKEAAK